MTQIPEDAPRSEDGHYWWDGTDWQQIDQSQGVQQTAADAGQAAGTQAGAEHGQQETEKRQVMVAASGVAGAEAPAPDAEVA